MTYPATFDHRAFPAIGDATAPSTKGVQKRVAQLATNFGSLLRASPTTSSCAEDLWVQITSSGARSQSFKNSRPPLAAIDGSTHFKLVPGIDGAEIRWRVTNPTLVDTLRFELWANTIGDRPVWSQELKGGAAHSLLQSGGGSGPKPFTDIAITGDATRFPGQVPNLAFAPYQLRMVLECSSGAVTTAWTYFDVVAHSIELGWGEATLIPGTPIANTLSLFQADTTRDEAALLAGLRGTSIPLPTSGITELRLPSTCAAYVHLHEWYTTHDFSYLRHRGRWGDGPRLPILARIRLARADDSVADADAATPAIGPAKLMWDWHDRPLADRDREARAIHATAGAYVTAALRYKENGAGEPRDCLNTHVDRGGKRGSTQRIFLDSDGRSFPFEVQACTTRTWASCSTVATSGTRAGWTGVLFQPSRIAKDSYRISVMLAVPGVDALGRIDDLIAANVGLPVARTATFEVIRQIDARYVRKHTSTPRMDLALIGSSYALGGVHVEWTEATWSKAQWDNLLAAALAWGRSVNAAPDAGAKRTAADVYNTNPPTARGKRHNQMLKARAECIGRWADAFGGRLFTDYDHWFGARTGHTVTTPSQYSFVLPSRQAVIDHYVAAATKTYINRDRFINTVKRKWNSFRAKPANAGVSETIALVRFHAQKVGTTDRTAITQAARDAYNGDGWRDYDQTNELRWNHANHNYKTKGDPLLCEIHQRKSMEDGFQGMTFFHYTNIYQTLDSAGTAVQTQCDIGGVAAVHTSSDHGLRALFSVWDHPTAGSRGTLAATLGESGVMKNGNYTAVHEFGHFMHLSHATPTGSGIEAAPHDPGDAKCIMNYDHDALHLCGVCCLRIRGWALFAHAGSNALGFSPANPNNGGGNAPATTDDKLQPVLDTVFAQAPYVGYL